MKSLFNKIDRSLSTAKVIVNIFTALQVLSLVVGSIFLMFVSVLIGIIVLFAGLVVIFVFYTFWKVLVSFLVDVKLIRNKVYGASPSEIANDYGVSLASKNNCTYYYKY